MSVYQISLFLENRAGQLAEVTRVLADNAIDMRAISIAETSDYGVLRLIVDDADISQFTRRNLTRRMASLFDSLLYTVRENFG